MLEGMQAFLKIVSGTAVTLVIGFAAFLIAGPGAMQWYTTLAKPALVPPEWIFIPLWLVLYALMTVALGIIWSTEPHTTEREGWVRFYFIQVLFNAAWVMFFFGLHAILVAFIDMLFLAFIVGALIAGAWDIDRRAAYVLAPYFACTLFIAFLNLNIWFLN